MDIKTLSLDLETYSSAPLAKCGVYKYAESPDFEILLFGYAVDGGEVQVVDLTAGESIPKEIINALTDDSVIKWAYNAQFERICISRFLGLPTGQYLDPASWHCTMVWAATLGLPLSLDTVGSALKLEKQKLKEGKDLIRYFCTPSKNREGQMIRHYPKDAPDRWVTFKAYNKRDVETDSLRNWRIGYGADLVAGYGNQSKFSVQQAFADLQWKMLRLSLGQKERPSELKNAEISTGGMTLGMNARPIPQIRLELPEFWTVPGTKGWFAIKAHIAYGWYTDNKWQRSFAGTRNPMLDWTSEIVPIKQSGAVTLALLGGWGVVLLFAAPYLFVSAYIDMTLYLAVWAVIFLAASALLLRWIMTKGVEAFEQL